MRALNPRWQNAAIIAALILGTFALYYPVIHFDFVDFDDYDYVVYNLHVNHGLNLPDLRWAFQAGYASNWHPLTWMSHMLDAQLFGLKPGMHHLTNVVFHALDAALVFALFHRMTRARWRSALVAALFAWHPLHVESVAWIAERKDVLCAFFWLLSLLSYLEYARERPGGGGRRKIYYAATLCLFALALMAKPMAVTLPFVLLLLDWWPLRRFQKGVGRLIVEKSPFFLLSALGCWVTMIAQSRAMQTFTRVPLHLRVENALESYLRYIGKLLLPLHLSIIYPLGDRPVWWQAALVGLVLAVISGAVYLARVRRPALLVGWLWYLGTLVPVIGIIQVGGQTMADRYSYLPSLGLFMGLFWNLGETTPLSKSRRVALTSFAVAALSAYAVVAERQIQYWRNSLTIFAHAVAVTSDNYAAHSLYAGALDRQNKLELAIHECKEAIACRPKFPAAHTRLASILYQEGKLNEAEKELNVALQLDPGEIKATHFIGEIAIQRNQPEKAIAAYSLELQRDPDDPGAHCGIGKALALESKWDGAEQEFRKALAAVDAYPEAHYQLALILEMKNQIPEAIAHYRKAILLAPTDANSLNNLAWILAANPNPKIRNGKEAVAFASKACQLTHFKQPLMIGTLAAAEAEASEFDKAEASARQAAAVANAQGKRDIAARNVELEKLYHSHHAYHMPP